MKDKNCLERIRDSYPSLNNAQQKVAKYILENPKDIIHFSITELADNSSTSDATVFRLCNKLGYKGYQELKISLASVVVKPIQNIHEEIKEDDNMYIVMHKIMNANIDSLENTLKKNSVDNIENSVEMLLKAGKVMFFGMGGSGALAMDACHKFVRTGLDCITYTDSHWQAMMAAIAKEDDVIVAFSNSGSNKELIESLKIGKENGVKIIAITGNAKSPISKLADIVLVAYGRESMFRSEAMESRITALSLIDCLYVGVALKRKEETLSTLSKIREGIATKRF